MSIRSQLEKHYSDMQDIEFTIEEGKLYILQTRNAKRTVFAWLRTCVEMVDEKLIDETTAIKRVPSAEFSKLFNPILDSADILQKNCQVLTSALNASPGGACGQIYFSAEDAVTAKNQGKKVMLVRMETSPEDITGMAVSEGILTARGGMTSHAAVVARGMGCPCVCGASDLRVDYLQRTMSVGKTIFKEGDFISIDGFSGEVYGEHIEVKPSEITQVLSGDLSSENSLLATHYLRFMKMIDKYRTLGVRTNADSAKDIKFAIEMGAEGIGLTRTEHMFFDKDRINTMREMILADSKIARVSALKKLLPMQREDFEAIFTTLAGRPATIRLLDPPLHEFLPHGRSNVNALAQSLSISPDWIKHKVSDMKEENPMLGFRGCRIGIVYPEIFDMQIRAIIEAAIHVADRNVPVFPEIMIPLIGHVKELKILKDRAITVIAEVFREYSKEIPCKIGTMIEVPRAALTADEIATEAEFFSFGTNDLTQMTCGFSRDDSGSFLPEYVKAGIYDYDPFAVLDQSGVGKLMIEAIKLGRSVRPDIKLGICGEHGGDPKTVAFCHDIGLDYVSCSPYRVPVARLAAAQAALA
jgi:pyruvate,orthophosphate dikinase